MKRLLSISLMVLAALLFGSLNLTASETILAEKGGTTAAIVLPEVPSLVEQTAAKELQTHLKEVTGVEFPVLSETAVKKQQPLLLLGGTKRTLELLAKNKIKTDFAFDEILVRNLEGNIILFGHERRGTLYAVYTFLEDVVGCRWWTPTESYFPKISKLSVKPELCICHAPQIISREMYNRLAQPGVFSARLKGNGNISKEYGGRISIHNFVHSFYKYIPPEKYFKDHPEWFSEIKGKRTCDQAQLCLTNDEMRKELTKNLLEQLRNKPETKIVDISQNDWYKFCTCEKCKAVDDREESNSGTLIQFLNKVAADVEKEFPDVLVETLAYQYTRKPPKTIRPRSNILIRLCSIECSFSEPLESPVNEKFASDIKGWRAISKQLFIWDYVTNYNDYIGPFPNYRTIVPNLRFFVKNGVIGLFAEGEGDDFAELRNWILLHLMWNPDLDENRLTNDFLNGYYGKEVAPFLKEYRTLISDTAEKSKAYIGCFALPTPSWLDFATLTKATDIFQKAVKVAEEKYGKDSPELHRLLKTKLAVDRLWLKYHQNYQREARLAKVAFTDSKNLLERWDEFIKRCQDNNIPSYDIRTRKDQIIKEREQLELMCIPPKSLPDFCKGVDKNYLNIFDDGVFKNVNKAATYVSDPAAWNKKATAMSTKVDWNVNYTPCFDGKYHVYVALRCDAENEEGPAMTFGVYDWVKKKNLYSKTISVKELRGKEYKWIDFGIVPFTRGAGFWFAHRHNKSVSNVFVDRLIAIEEK